jgi:hypothetical protein
MQYNSRHSMKFLRQASAAVFLLLLVAASAQAAERWDAELASFAQKIAAVSGPGTASLELRNLSSLPEQQAAAIRRGLEEQLRQQGVTLTAEQAAAAVIRVTLSENQRGMVWIAEVRLGTDTKVTMLEVSRPGNAAAAGTTPAMRLESSLLFHSKEAVLDVQPLRTPQPWMAAVTARSVELFEEELGGWQLRRSIPLPLSIAARDPRGRIIPAEDHLFDIYLPGAICSASGDQIESAGLRCTASDDPWPLGEQRAMYNSARNYFTGVLLPGLGRAEAPFYSAAAIPFPRYMLWIFAGVDGRIRSYDGVNELAIEGSARSWGSDIAAIHAGIGSGTQVLASEEGTDPESDSLGAYEIDDREAVTLSAPLRFAGNITALWPAGEGDRATAVVRNAQGGYDAYTVTLADNQ